MTQAEMLSVLEPSDIVEIMVHDNHEQSVIADVKDFLRYKHGLEKPVLNAIIIYALLKAEHYTGFNVYLRKVMESFKKSNVDDATKALDYIRTSRIIKRRHQSTVIEPEYLQRYLDEIERMG